MNAFRVRVSLLFALFAMAAAARPALGQRTQTGPFDPRSGRFGAALPIGPDRAPDTLAVTQARAWAVVGQLFADLGIPVSVVDTSSHVLGALRATQRRPVAGERLSRILECGTGSFGPNAERYTVQLTVLASVQARDAGHATVETRVGGVAAPNGLSSSVTCASTGVLEDRITAELRKVVGS